MQAPCGTRAAIIAHHEYGEPLDGPCAAADTAMRLEAERRQPYKTPLALDDSPGVCAQRRHTLLSEVLAWEAEHRRNVSGRSGKPTHLRSASAPSGNRTSNSSAA